MSSKQSNKIASSRDFLIMILSGNLKLKFSDRSQLYNMHHDMQYNIVELHLFLNFPSRIMWEVNSVFHRIYSTWFFTIPKYSSQKLLTPSCCHPFPPQLLCPPLSCLLSLWRWEVLTRGAHVRGERWGKRTEGGRRAYFRTQEWLACCFWVTGDGPPAWCIRTTHTETHTANADGNMHIYTQC